MERVNDKKLLYRFFDKYEINRYFAIDIKDDVFLVKFARSEAIQNTGDSVDVLYFVVDGTVKVSSIQENGKSKLVCIVHPFDMLGDIEIFAEMDYINDVVALSDTYCIGLSLEKYRDILLADPVFTKYMASTLAKIVLNNNETVSFNMLNSLETRVATYILLSAKNNSFKENLTHLAELMATSYRHLHRVLSGLCDKKILAKEGRIYKIIDEERLREMSNESISHF